MTFEVKSPIPGVFYLRPSPDAEPFVKVGDHVEQDTVIGLVEVMKTFHDIEAGHTGTILTIDVVDGNMVDAGQLVATIAAAATSEPEV